MPEEMNQMRGRVRVKIGSVRLGVPLGSETPSRPNPKDIVWEQVYGIEKKYPVGRKPITQVTQPLALWTATITYEVTHDAAMNEVRDLGVGPHLVETSLHKICMYLERKRMSQHPGTDDHRYNVTLQLIEANDGGEFVPSAPVTPSNGGDDELDEI
jgi:hypothetical protein